MGLMDFMSREAAGKRRQWLDDTINENLQYFLGPTGIPDKLGAVNQLLNPIANIEASQAAGTKMVSPGVSGWDRVKAAGDMTSGIAGAVAPAVATKLAGGGGAATANAISEMFTNVSAGPRVAAAGFAADETGSIGVPFVGDDAAKVGIKAYHGSPHSFDKFSMDKIGTGEGAQAYGHGLYFAENKGIAKGYRDDLSGGGISAAKRSMGIAGGDVDAAIQRRFAEIERLKSLPNSGGDPEQVARMLDLQDDALRQLNHYKENGDWLGGSLYEVNINANPDDFLDWDAPLSAQPQKVRDALEKFGAKPDEPGQVAFGRAGRDIFPIKGADGRWGPGGATYDESLALVGGDKSRVNTVRSGDPASRSAVTKEAGIPGIKYLDAGSRGAGDGSRNYVVFDENLVSIVKKYGIAGAAIVLGVPASEVQAAVDKGRTETPQGKAISKMMKPQ